MISISSKVMWFITGFEITWLIPRTFNSAQRSFEVKTGIRASGEISSPPKRSSSPTNENSDSSVSESFNSLGDYLRVTAIKIINIPVVLLYLKTSLTGHSETRSKNYFCFCLFRFWLKDCFLNLISGNFRYKSRCAQNLFVLSRI